MFGSKWKGETVVIHTGISTRSKRKAHEKARQHGYEYAGESAFNVTFRKRRRPI